MPYPAATTYQDYSSMGGGYYKGEQITIEHQKNATTHQPAIQCQWGEVTNTVLLNIADLSSSHVASVSHFKKIIAGLPQKILTYIHYAPLIAKILKDTGWSEMVFGSVLC
jgi:hypothetical protein